jgi:hypothetical protein
MLTSFPCILIESLKGGSSVSTYSFWVYAHSKSIVVSRNGRVLNVCIRGPNSQYTWNFDECTARMFRLTHGLRANQIRTDCADDIYQLKGAYSRATQWSTNLQAKSSFLILPNENPHSDYDCRHKKQGEINYNLFVFESIFKVVQWHMAGFMLNRPRVNPRKNYTTNTNS